MSKRVFVTKYALTEGISEVTLIDGDTYPTISVVAWELGSNGRLCVNKKDVHDTLEAAYTRVRTMIASKKKSHDKALKKLNQLLADCDGKALTLRVCG